MSKGKKKRESAATPAVDAAQASGPPGELPRVLELQDEFVAQWGALGSQWGINRHMAQIHALAMTSSGPLSTDDVMARLEISRGSASTNLRELVNWGLLRPVIVRGDRKDYYEAEKDVWKMACTIARERKKREIEPTIALLQRCSSELSGSSGPEAEAFRNQLGELLEFVQFTSNAAEKVTSSKQGLVMKLAAQLLR